MDGAALQSSPHGGAGYLGICPRQMAKHHLQAQRKDARLGVGQGPRVSSQPRREEEEWSV